MQPIKPDPKLSLAIFNATPLSYGGGFERFIISVEAEARKRGYQAQIVVPPARHFKRVVRCLGLARRFSHLHPAESQTDWAFLRSASHIYVKNEPLDLLWLRALRPSGQPVIGFHTPLRYPPDTLARRLRNRVYASGLYWRLLRGAKLHFLTNAESQLLPAALRQQRTAVIANGIEAATPARHAGGALKFLFVGRLTQQKGLDRLVPLLGRHPDVRLTIVGDGEERMNLERLFGEQARFLGMQSPAVVKDLLQTCDILVMPSRWEGQPFALLESMATGCVPIISNIPALVDVLPPSGRWLGVNFDDPDDFARCLERVKSLYARGDAWEALKVTLFDHVTAHFNQSSQLEKLLQFIFGP